MSKLFKDTLAKIKENKINLDSGKPNCIPFNQFPRLSKILPGIVQGTNILISASSGVGKTKFTKSVFVLEPLNWLNKHLEENPNSNINIQVNYFGLEESKEEFVTSVICYKLEEKFGITIDALDLMSMYQKETVSEDLLKKIESLESFFEKFFNHVDYIDTISNPYGIYDYIRNYTQKNGTHYFYNFIDDRDKDNCITHAEKEKVKKLHGKESKEYKQLAYSHYTPNNPDEYVINIVDHMSLLSPENEGTLHDAMTQMSASYGRKQITKHYNHVFVNVQQQMGSQEADLYTNSGKKIIEKLKPSIAGLADCKLTIRDAHVAIGLFAPARYLPEDDMIYKGYDISVLKDQFRSAIVLKNRIGRGNIEIPLLFNGAINTFEELPAEMKKEDYDIVRKMQKTLK